MAPPKNSGSFELIAHRGLSQLAPENTLAAFDLALARGFRHFETDVQLTSDGRAVVVHDEVAPGRTLSVVVAAEGDVGGDGIAAAPCAAAAIPPRPPRPVGECTLAELRAMDAAAWFWRAGGPAAMLPEGAPPEAVAAAAAAAAASAGAPPPPTPPPTMDEVLLRYRGRAHVHLELKSRQPGLARAVLDALERTGWRGDLEEQARAAEAAAADGEGEEEEEEEEEQRAGCGAVPGLTLTSFHLEQLLRVAEELAKGHGAASAPAGGGRDGGAEGAPLSPPPPLLPPRWLRRHWLVQELDAPTLAAIAAVRGGGLTGVCPRANAATREGVEAARRALLLAAEDGDRKRLRRPVEVRAWGVRSLALLARAVEVGADGATVNWPHLARDHLFGEGGADG